MFVALEAQPASAHPSAVAHVSKTVRVFAKGVDAIVMLLLTLILPYPVGALCAFLYSLVSDGMFGGQSIGKKLFHLKVVHVQESGAFTYKESAIRNSPFGVAALFGLIPLWGWLLLVLIGFPLIAIELYLMWSRNGERLGDVMADTRVIDIKLK